MRRFLTASAILLSLCCLVLWGSGSAQAAGADPFQGLAGTLHIAGGTAHIKCETEAARLIMRAHPKVRITIAGGGSGVGIQQVCQGLIGLGNSGRPPTEAEIKRCGLKVYRFAVDGIAVVVNPSNPVAGISKADLRAVFAGRITNWRQLGGKDAPIDLYTRDAQSGTRKVFWKKGLDKGEISPKANFVASNAAMKTAVAGDPNAIGYISLGVADQSVKLLAIDGVAPSPEAVKSGRYRIARGLFMVTKGEPKPLARAFIQFMLSPRGQKLVAKHGFLPVK